MNAWWLKKAAAIVAVTAVTILALGGLVTVLWNALMPDVFGVPALTYWQGVSLLLLTQILLRGVGRWRASQGPPSRDHWKRKFEEKLASMAPEERERFKEEWERRCGCGPQHTAENDKNQ